MQKKYKGRQQLVLASDKKALKKDLIVDPGNRKEVEEATKSGFTLTDEASDLSR